MRILLLPISLFYHIVLTIRHKLYDWKLLKTSRFEKPVICVGNLNLGGTGKTPHTEYLIELLKNDYHLATLSSGYGRKSKGFRLAESSCTYEDLGDEPLQYFTKYPDIQVAVERLINLDKKTSILKRKLTIIDLRFENKVLVTPKKDSVKSKPDGNQAQEHGV